MIEIKFTGMCEDCKAADLEVHRLIINAGCYIWTVTCNHNNACERMKTKMGTVAK